jgi:transcriptional regulator with XRE-family HTH domain
LTQYDLAHGEVTAAHISRIETGDRRPSIALLEQLARKLGTDAETLMGGAHSAEARVSRSVPDDYLAAKRVAKAAAAWHAQPTVRHYEVLVGAVTAWTTTQREPNAPASP